MANLSKRGVIREAFNYMTGRNWPEVKDDSPLSPGFVNKHMFGGRIDNHPKEAEALRRYPDSVTLGDFKTWVERVRGSRSGLTSARKRSRLIRLAEKSVIRRKFCRP